MNLIKDFLINNCINIKNLITLFISEVNYRCGCTDIHRDDNIFTKLTFLFINFQEEQNAILALV